MRVRRTAASPSRGAAGEGEGDGGGAGLASCVGEAGGEAAGLGVPPPTGAPRLQAAARMATAHAMARLAGTVGLGVTAKAREIDSRLWRRTTGRPGRGGSS